MDVEVPWTGMGLDPEDDVWTIEPRGYILHGTRDFDPDSQRVTTRLRLDHTLHLEFWLELSDASGWWAVTGGRGFEGMPGGHFVVTGTDQVLALRHTVDPSFRLKIRRPEPAAIPEQLSVILPQLNAEQLRSLTIVATDMVGEEPAEWRPLTSPRAPEPDP